MDAKKASEILFQIAQAAQKAGLLTLDEAVVTVQAMQTIKEVITSVEESKVQKKEGSPSPLPETTK